VTVPITPSERELLHAIHVKADELARMLQEANGMGFHVNFNMNPLLGTCDRFDVVKMVSIDLKGGAN
jgi:hypothetical protein